MPQHDPSHQDHPTRIKASVQRLSEISKQLEDERERRDQLIVEACDGAGMASSQAAAYAGITQTQVNRILAKASA